MYKKDIVGVFIYAGNYSCGRNGETAKRSNGKQYQMHG